MCVRSRVIHTEADVNVGLALDLDKPDFTGSTVLESNGTSLTVNSRLGDDVSGNITSYGNVLTFKDDTIDLFGDVNKSTASSDGSPSLASTAGESLIDASSVGSVAVLDEPSLTSDKTTQFTTDIKSTEKFSSQIPPDSPTPTLSSVTNSSLVAKETLTGNLQTSPSVANINNVPETTPYVNTEITGALPVDDAAAVGLEITGTVLDATLDLATTGNPVTEDVATTPAPDTAEVDLVQNLPVLSKTTDGFDLIMDSAIEAAINDNVKLDTTTAEPSTTQAVQIDSTSAPLLGSDAGTTETVQTSTETNSATANAGSTDTNSFTDNAGFTDTNNVTANSGSTDTNSVTANAESTDTNIVTANAGFTDNNSVTDNAGSTDTNSVTPNVGSTDTNSVTAYADDGHLSPADTATEVVTTETVQESSTVKVLPLISDNAQTLETGVSVSASITVEPPLDTTTSADNVVNAQIKTTEQFTEPVRTSSISTEENLKSTENPIVSTEESSSVSPSGDTASSTARNSVLKEFSIDTTVQNQEDPTNEVDQLISTTVFNKTIASLVVDQTTSVVPVDQTASGLADVKVQTTETKPEIDITVESPVQMETTTKSSQTDSTMLTMTESAKGEETGSHVSDVISSQPIEPTKAAVRETTQQTALPADVQVTTGTEEQISARTTSMNEADTTSPVTSPADEKTTESASSTSDFSLNIEQTKSTATSAMESADPAIAATSTTESATTSTPTVSTTTESTAAAAATTTTTAAPTTVSTTQRPCPVFKTKYNRNDLIVTTEPEGCTMLVHV